MQCTKCHTVSTPGDFYSGSAQCKECVRARTRAHRWANIDRERERDRKRPYRTTGRKAPPMKRRAQVAACNAVRDGRLTRPDSCSRCAGGKSRIEGHHPDYSKLLDVTWLCVPCHRVVHGLTIGAPA
jgi:hypothetical protein